MTPAGCGSAYAIMPVQGYPKLLVDAFNQLRVQFGDKMAALGPTGNYDTLPVAKGGTGATTGPTALSSLGLRDGAYDMLIKSIGFRGAPVTTLKAFIWGGTATVTERQTTSATGAERWAVTPGGR